MGKEVSMTKKETTVNLKMVQKAQKYVSSSEGKKSISSALKSAQNVISRLNDARRVDPKSLHEPVTL